METAPSVGTGLETAENSSHSFRIAKGPQVAWTPEGYCLASPGGEELIGWLINRGLDEAPDFHPVGQFRA